MAEDYLSKEQLVKFNEWKKSIAPKYTGAIGGQFGLNIIFTSMGDIIIGYSVNGDKIDLTDYNLF
jgi:hypothetical protein